VSERGEVDPVFVLVLICALVATVIIGSVLLAEIGVLR
jgi:hypothetical protein